MTSDTSISRPPGATALNLPRELVRLLSGVPETALITLAARVLAPIRHPDLGFRDPIAEQLSETLGVDPKRFENDHGSMRGSILRARWFDSVTLAFAARHPTGAVVSVGSGLDTRAYRLALPQTLDWLDIDFDTMIRLRNAALPEKPAVRGIAADGTDIESWLGAAGWEKGRPVLVLAEGVSMYLAKSVAEAWVQGLVRTAEDKGSPLWLAIDLASPLMVRTGRYNPSVRETGAGFTWGVKAPAVLSRIAPGLDLEKTYEVAGKSGQRARIVAAVYKFLTRRSIYSCALFHTRRASECDQSLALEGVPV